MESIQRYWKRTDKTYLLLCILSSSFAVLALSSWAAKQGSGFALDDVTGQIVGVGDYRRAVVQAGAAAIGLCVAVLLSNIDYRSLVKVWPVHVAVTWGMVLPTLFIRNVTVGPLTIGYNAGDTDNYSWYKLGGFTLQPTELAKISFILTFAMHLNNVRGKINEPKELGKLLLHMLVPILIIHIQGDDGTAIIYGIIACCMMFSAGLSWKYIIGAISAAAAAVAAVLLATPALAVRSETGYAVLYRIAPAVAQFFQPIQEACTDSGITMEVAAVRVEGDTAQAYIVLSGGPVDATTDLFDSWSFHLPFDQTGRCERVAWDEATGTVTFLCTVKTMDGSPIPTGGKMTFSVRQLLTGKKAMEGVTVDLKLTNYAQEAETALTWGADLPAAGVREPEVTYYSATGGSGDLASVMLQPGEVLAEPAEGLPITAAGYADGLFHIQLCRGDASRTDNHAFLWMEDADGREFHCTGISYFTGETAGGRTDYMDFLFAVPPEELAGCTLHGNFYTAATLTEGLWQVTFPLENTD